MSHTLRMLIGCVLPLLLIFLLPLLGLGQGLIPVVFLVLMLGCHLWMMRGHDDAYEHRPGGTGGGSAHHEGSRT